MLTAAIIGLGWWGKAIVERLRNSDALRILHAVDVDPAQAAWARAHGLAFGTELGEALADPAVRAVILCTPHAQHTAQIAAAAAAGRHVFCEKPLALTRREAAASVALCAAHHVVLGVGHERRFEPPVCELARLARSGVLGTLLQIEASFCQDKFLALPAGNWRLSAAEAPAGPLTATGIHMLDLGVSLLGAPVSAAASVGRLGSALANGDTLGALVRFGSGANLLLSAVLATPFAGRLMVYGNQGWAEIRDKAHPEKPAGWALTLCRRGGAPESIDYPATDAVQRNLEAFAAAATGGAPYPIPSEEMVATIAALEAIVTSAATGRVVPVAASPAG